MPSPDITVLIPTFRRPALLREAIDSALAQQGVSVEIVVVDDSAEGGARDTVASIADARITYLHNDPPSGGRPALVRNAGLHLARGRFIHFLDDDDRAVPGFYRAAVTAFEANPNKGVVFGGIEPFGDDPKALAHERAFFADAGRRARVGYRTRSRRFMTAMLLFQNTVLVNSACMIRRECIQSIGGYSSDVIFNEDVEFYARAIRRFGCVFLNRPVLQYRILSDSLMHGRDDDRQIAESYRRMYARYRSTNGAGELFALKVFSRTLLRFL